MPTGKTKSRCAWEAVNLPASRCLQCAIRKKPSACADGASWTERRALVVARRTEGRALVGQGVGGCKGGHREVVKGGAQNANSKEV